MWLFWVLITSVVTSFCFVLFASLLVNKKTRRNSFNLYLVFLVTPDMFFSGLCCINCALNIAKGEFYSEKWCRFQDFYCMFGIGKNKVCCFVQDSPQSTLSCAHHPLINTSLALYQGQTHG